MKAAVIGASGYSGGELLRLLADHPHFTCSSAIAHTQKGEQISSVHPQLIGAYSGSFSAFMPELIMEADLIFLALPHGESGKLITEHSEIFEGKKIIDLGADFRLKSNQSWEKYYGEHIQELGNMDYPSCQIHEKKLWRVTELLIQDVMQLLFPWRWRHFRSLARNLR